MTEPPFTPRPDDSPEGVRSVALASEEFALAVDADDLEEKSYRMLKAIALLLHAVYQRR